MNEPLGIGRVPQGRGLISMTYKLFPAFILVTLLFSRPSAAEVNSLFNALDGKDVPWAEAKSREVLAKDKTINHIEFFRLTDSSNLEKTLQAALHGSVPGPTTISLPNIGPIIFVTTNVTRTSPGYLHWTGRVNNDKSSLVSLTVHVSTPEKQAILSGTLFYQNRRFAISPETKGLYRIAEIDSAQFPPDELPHPIFRKGATGLGLRRHFTTPVPAPPVNPSWLLDTCRIDVLVAYTTDAKAEAAGSIDSEIRTAIDLANITYSDSGVSQRLNLVNAVGVNYETCVAGQCYTEKTTLDAILDNVTSANPKGSSPPQSGDDAYPLTSLYKWRDELNADVVALWVKGPQDQNGNPLLECGASYIMQEDSSSPGTFPDDPNYPYSAQAFAVASRKCAKDNHSMEHEIGHLGGLHHDRGYEASEAKSTTVPGDTLYHYGYAYPSADWRTIMAENLHSGWACPSGGTCCISCRRIPSWSNPDKSYNGVATGVRDQDPPPTLEWSADSHRTLNKSASILAGFRFPFVRAGVCEGTVDTLPPAIPSGLRVQ